MKKNYFTILVLFGLLQLMNCSKKSDSNTSTVTSDDVASTMSDALSSDFSSAATSGTNITNTQVSKANARVDASSCGVLQDTTITVSSGTGRIISFNWTGRFKTTLNCTGNLIKIPTSTVTTITSSGNTSGLFLTTTGTSAANFTFTFLSTPVYSLTGSFTRQSSIVKKSDNKSFTGNTTITLNSLSIDKSTTKINSGGGTFSVSGQSNSGTSYSYSGTFTYTSSNTVILTIDANTYTLDLDTGKVTKS